MKNLSTLSLLFALTIVLNSMANSLHAEPTKEQQELLDIFRKEFIEITPGKGKYPKSFEMGRKDAGDKEQPVRKVTFSYSFGIAKYEVPQNLWEAVMGENPSRWTGPRNSVEMLDYKDAINFCKKATAMMRELKLIKNNQVIRLPSEAEWEYTARAGTATAYSFGDDAEDLGPYAWFSGNAAGNDPPVGAKKPNSWGLYDVHGYLWEWCLDSDGDYKGAPTDGHPQLADDAERYIVRGGSWKSKPPELTSSYRLAAPTGAKADDLGLRCVLATEK